MRRWQADRSTMQRSWSRPGPLSFALRPGETRQDPSRVYPVASDIRRQLAASGCTRGPGADRRVRRVTPGQLPFLQVLSGGRGIRTHGDVAATMVFKTIAIGH